MAMARRCRRGKPLPTAKLKQLLLMEDWRKPLFSQCQFKPGELQTLQGAPLGFVNIKILGNTTEFPTITPEGMTPRFALVEIRNRKRKRVVDLAAS